DKALRVIINGYTRESGLRNFEREIASICRKVARKVAEGQTGTIRITPGNVVKFLGAAKILPDEILKDDQVGIATGMAWTASAGGARRGERRLRRGRGCEGRARAPPGGRGGGGKEGGGPARPRPRPPPPPPVRHQGGFLRQPRPARARARGRDPQGRPVRRDH